MIRFSILLLAIDVVFDDGWVGELFAYISNPLPIAHMPEICNHAVFFTRQILQHFHILKHHPLTHFLITHAVAIDNLYQYISKMVIEGIDYHIALHLRFLREGQSDILTNQFQSISHDVPHQWIDEIIR